MAPALTLRLDHGTQYTSEDFINQVKAWGVTISYAYVAEPQTNGISERFIRTLKEQVINGKVHRNLDQLREAIARFIENYNSQWLLERLRTSPAAYPELPDANLCVSEKLRSVHQEGEGYGERPV